MRSKLLWVASIFLLLVAACGATTERDSVSEGLHFLDVTVQPTPHTGGIPFFLIEVEPAPSRAIILDKYEEALNSRSAISRGIVIEMSPLDFDDRSHSYPEEAGDNVILFVDGDLISNNSMLVDDGLVEHQDGYYGPFWISWNPELRLGMHTAEVWIKTSTGEVLAYQWDFEIIR